MDMERKAFVSPEGVVVGTAAVPSAYTPAGTLIQKWQSDLVPFTASMAAVSQDGGVILVSTSKEIYEDYPDPYIKQTVRNMPSAIQSGYRDFIEPGAYLLQFAQNIAQCQLQPSATAVLPSAFGNDPQGSLNQMVNYFRTHTVNVNVRIEISNAICQGLLVRYTGVRNGQNLVVLAGMDYQGVEYYDANNSMAMIQGMMNPFGALGSLFGGAKPQQQVRQAQGPVPFGHAKEYGKKVDCIQWGANRSYAAVMPAEREAEGTEAFLAFVSTLAPDQALSQEFERLAREMYNQRIMEAQGYAQQAQVARMNLMQSQQNLAQTLARNSQEMSAGLMDSWNKKMASDSRISANYSEAIRGVNTYTGLDGRPVEVSTVADHVYQNQYGETFGVSGPALDPSLTTRINWTEIGRS